MQTIKENVAGEDLGKTYDKNVLQGNIEESGDFYLQSEQLRGSIEATTEAHRSPINQRISSEQGTDERAENPKSILLDDPATVQTDKTELLKAQHKIPPPPTVEGSDEAQALPVEMASKPAEPESIEEVDASNEQDGGTLLRSAQESQRQEEGEE